MIREIHKDVYEVKNENGVTFTFDYEDDDPAYVRSLIAAATEYLKWREKWNIA